MRPSKEKGFNRAGECATGRLEMDCREKDRPVAGVGGGRGSGIPSVPVYVSHGMALDPDRGGIELLSRSDDPPTHTQKERREGGSGTGSKEATSPPPLPHRRQIVAFAAGPKSITAVGHPAFPLGRLMKGFHEEKAPRPCFDRHGTFPCFTPRCSRLHTKRSTLTISPITTRDKDPRGRPHELHLTWSPYDSSERV
jgi:hypothetical protein